MILRAGRADLHDRLNAASYEGKLWSRRELSELLREGASALLTCPHVDCAYCYAVEHQEATR